MEKANPLRILFVEDLPSDAELAEREIRKSGLEFTSRRVDTKDSFLGALEEFQPDVIVSDYMMPEFDGMQALRLSLKHDSKTPFIILTGSMNEETAVECMKAGATDYVIKEHIARLPFAVNEALQQKTIRIAKEEAERALRESESRYRSLFEDSSVPIWEEDFSAVKVFLDQIRNSGENDSRAYFGNHPEAVLHCASLVRILGVNRESLRVFKVDKREDISINLPRYFTEESLTIFKEELVTLAEGRTTFESEIPILSLSGDILQLILRLTVVPGYEQTLSRVHVSFIDITERKQAEETLKKQYSTLRSIIDSTEALIFSLDRQYRYTSFNHGHASVMKAIYGAEIKIGHSLLDYMTVAEDREKAKRNLDRALAGEQIREEAYSGEEPRSRLYFQVSHSPIRTEEGEIIGVAVLSQDMTERRRMEEALLISEKDLKEAQRIAQIGSWDWDSATDAIRWSEEYYRIYGLDPKQSPPGYEEHLKAYTPESAARLDAAVKKSMETGEPYEIDLEQVRPDGTRGWVTSRCEIKRDAKGRIVGLCGTAQDITERKRAEEALKKSEASLEEAQRVDHLGSWEWDPVTDTPTWSKELCAILEVDPTKPAPSVAEQDKIYTTASMKRMRSAIEQAMAGTPYEIELERVREDGTRKWLLARGEAMLDKNGHIIGLRGTALDITGRKQVEALLQESEGKYRILAESSPEMIYVIGRDGRISYVNNTAALQFRSDPLELVGKQLTEIFPSDIAQQNLQGVQQVIHSKQPSCREILQQFPVGEKWVEARLSPILDERGEVSSVMGLSIDISERKKAEETQLLLTTALESTANGVTITDPRGNIVWVNKAFTAMTGYTWTEVLGQNPRILKSGKQDSSFYKDLWETISAGNVWAGELINKKKDGSLYTDEMMITPLKKNNGEITNFIAVKQDITQRKKAEETLVKLKKAIETSGEAVFLTDLKGIFTFVNPGFTAMYGYAADEVIGKVTPRIFKSGVVTKEQYEAFWRSLTSGQEVRMEYRNKTKYGTLKYIDASASPIFNEKKEVTGFLGIQRDITERKRTEEALLNSERQYRLLAESSPEMIFLVGTDGRLSYVNAHAASEFNTTPQQLIGKHITQIFPPAIAQKNLQGIQRVITTKKASQREIVEEFPSGRKWVDSRLSPVLDDKGRVVAVLGLSNDINERKRVEQHVTRLAHALKSVSECVSVTDLNDRLLFVNEAFLKTYGYDEDELLGRNVEIVRSPKNSPEIVGRILKETLRGGWHGELLNRKKDGSEFLVSVSTSVVRDDVGEAVALVGVATDITERKRAEDELRRNRELLNSIFQTSRDGIVLEDENGSIVFVNDAYVRLFRFNNPEELIGNNVSIIQSAEENERMLEYARRRMQGEAVPTLYEFKGKCKDRSLIDLEVSVTVAEIGGKKHILSVVRDISERKRAEEDRRRLEEQIRQAQKMEAIGTLAGGIAHDFNNILGIILGHLSILQRPEYDASVRARSGETMALAVQRGANLVRQILTFARKTDVSLAPVSINESIKELRKMIQETFPKTIEFRFTLEKALPLVIMDAGQLNQALLNLCVNARDAILDAQQRGSVEATIAISTALVAGEKLREKYREASEEQYISVAVRDSGIGMDDATRKRIFEPFFTTKEPGKGTGMGLSVVYGVVQSAHGFVDVQSTPGCGSTFTLYFPVPKDMVLTPRKVEKRVEEIPGGNETILLVEDEATLLAMLELRLQDKGYKTISAVDGVEALERFKQHRDRIDVVITDLGLPKMSGDMLLRELKKMKPNVRVLVASGYVEPSQKSELLEAGAKDIIAKPYEPWEVLKKIRDVLDAKQIVEP